MSSVSVPDGDLHRNRRVGLEYAAWKQHLDAGGSVSARIVEAGCIPAALGEGAGRVSQVFMDRVEDCSCSSSDYESYTNDDRDCCHYFDD